MQRKIKKDCFQYPRCPLPPLMAFVCMASVMVRACPALPRSAPPMAASGHAAPHAGRCAPILRSFAVAYYFPPRAANLHRLFLCASVSDFSNARVGFLSRCCKKRRRNDKKAALFPYNLRNNAALVRGFLDVKISFDAAPRVLMPNITGFHFRLRPTGPHRCPWPSARSFPE